MKSSQIFVSPACFTLLLNLRIYLSNKKPAGSSAMTNSSTTCNKLPFFYYIKLGMQANANTTRICKSLSIF